MTGISTHSSSESGSPYIIFALDEGVSQDGFIAFCTSKNIFVKELVGRYKGEEETSFLVKAENFHILFWAFAGQESILVLSPVGPHGYRAATLEYITDYEGRRPEWLGFFYQATPEPEEDWTHDLQNDVYFVCRKHWPSIGVPHAEPNVGLRIRSRSDQARLPTGNREPSFGEPVKRDPGKAFGKRVSRTDAYKARSNENGSRY